TTTITGSTWMKGALPNFLPWCPARPNESGEICSDFLWRSGKLCLSSSFQAGSGVYLDPQAWVQGEIDGSRSVLYRSRMKSLIRFLTRRVANAVAHQLTRQAAWEDMLMLQGVQAA